MIELLLLLSGADQAPAADLPPPLVVHTPPMPYPVQAKCTDPTTGLLIDCGPPPAPPPRFGPSLISMPDWQRLPNGDELAALFPDQAREYGLTGQTQIKCLVQAEGLLADCTVILETPSGFGFGRAALQSARYFRMRPKTVDGTPVTGGVVIIPVRWRLGRERAEPAAADLTAAQACLGWAQARADLDRSNASFQAAATLSEDFVEAARLAGLTPSQMAARRREALAGAQARMTRPAAAAASDPACRVPFRVVWGPHPVEPPAQRPDLPANLAQVVSDKRAVGEDCVALLAAGLEGKRMIGDPEWRAYAAWTKTVTWTNLMQGRSSAEINDRLDDLARTGSRRLEEPRVPDALGQCVTFSADAPPAG